MIYTDFRNTLYVRYNFYNRNKNVCKEAIENIKVKVWFWYVDKHRLMNYFNVPCFIGEICVKYFKKII